PQPTATISPLSLHDALPISLAGGKRGAALHHFRVISLREPAYESVGIDVPGSFPDLLVGDAFLVEPYIVLQPAAEQEYVLEHDRSEEHTSELQSRENLVCRL